MDTGEEKAKKFELNIGYMATVVYSIMATIGALIALYGHKNFSQIISLKLGSDLLWQLASITALGTGIILVFSFFFETSFDSFSSLRDSIGELLGPTKWYMAVYLALISAFGEELLFRAALQPYTGLLFASVLFGLMHIGPEGIISAWTIWAMLAGLLLGWVYQETANIWPPIIMHFVTNLIGILRIQKHYRDQECES